VIGLLLPQPASALGHTPLPLEESGIPATAIPLSPEDLIAAPDRITDLALSVRVSVAWATDEIRASFTEPDRRYVSAGRVVFQDEVPVVVPTRLSVHLADDEVELVGGLAAWRAALVPGTRSVWLRWELTDGVAYRRLDLPGPRIVGASIRSDKGGAGPQLILRVANLLPDFEVSYATEPLSVEADPGKSSVSADARSAYRTLRRSIGVVPHIAGATADEDGTIEITLRLPGGGVGPGVAYFVRVTNFDGSCSQTLRLEQRQGTIDERARTAVAATLAAIDAECLVPDVELIAAHEAGERVHQAGLVPIFLDLDTLRILESAAAKQRLVRRQGVPAGHHVRHGSELLLGVLGSSGESTIVYQPGRSPIPNDMPLMPATLTDFVPVDQTDLESAFGAPRDEPFGENREVPAGLDMVAAPELTDQPPVRPSDQEADTEVETDAEVDSEIQGPATIGNSSGLIVDGDPGVIIDPAVTEDQETRRAILEIVLRAIAQRWELDETLGAIGEIIRHVYQNIEDRLVDDLFAGKPASDWDIRTPLQELALRLSVQLAPVDLDRAVADWREFAARRNHPALLDANGDGIISDDIVQWLVAWLCRNDCYHPATHAQFISSAADTILAVLTTEPISPDWLTVADTLAGSVPQLPLPANEDSRPPQGDDERDPIPAGKPLIMLEGSPDLVRVPEEVAGKTAGETKELLQARGLSIDAEGKKLFLNDQVVGTRPEPGAWLKPSDRVALTIKRLVPDVTAGKAQQAVETLRGRELIPLADEHDIRFRASDIVTAQQPAAGAYVDRDTRVELTLKRQVPRVVGRRAAEALKLLQDEQFRVTGPERTLGSDIVAEQAPEAESLAELGSEVKLVRVEAIVPDLAGSSLSGAKTLTEAKQLLDDRKLNFEVLDPDTDYTLAKVLRQDPPFGQRIDRARQSVKMSLVVPVPSIGTGTSVNEALRTVEARDIGATLTHEQYRPQDVVIATQVASGTRQFRAGNTTYIPPQGQIVLTVGRKVPDVARQRWEEGMSAVTDADLKTSLPLGTGTHIHSTEPPGGRFVDLRQSVKIYAGVQIPRVYGRSLDDARRRLSDAGLRAEPGSPREVETADQNRIGLVFVDSSPSAQTPTAGEIVRKESVRGVRLSVIRYVEPRVIVPPLTELPVETARQRLSDLELQLTVRSVVAAVTPNEALDGQQTVLSQDPQAGTRVKKGTTVNVRTMLWKYVPPARELTTYALFPGRAQNMFGLFWRCNLSADRRSGNVSAGVEGHNVSYGLTLLDDQFMFNGKRCLTYQVINAGEVDQIRIPFDGIGYGQLREDGVWIFTTPGEGGLRFQTDPPRF
jgi:beta-lactam-binding protein with PASTA domain